MAVEWEGEKEKMRKRGEEKKGENGAWEGRVKGKGRDKDEERERDKIIRRWKEIRR